VACALRAGGGVLGAAAGAGGGGGAATLFGGAAAVIVGAGGGAGVGAGAGATGSACAVLCLGLRGLSHFSHKMPCAIAAPHMKHLAIEPVSGPPMLRVRTPRSNVIWS